MCLHASRLLADVPADYSCNETTDDAFTAGLVSFMRNITSLYEGSPGPAQPTRFFCTVGLMAPTAPLKVRAVQCARRAWVFLTLLLLQAVLNAIDQANAAGLRASFLDLRNGTKDGVRGCLVALFFFHAFRCVLLVQCGGHPGPIGHFQLASEAAPQIQAAMGW